jgi:hypothetical protein
MGEHVDGSEQEHAGPGFLHGACFLTPEYHRHSPLLHRLDFTQRQVKRANKRVVLAIENNPTAWLLLPERLQGETDGFALGEKSPSLTG